MEIVLWIYGFDFVWNDLEWGEFGNLNREVEILKKADSNGYINRKEEGIQVWLYMETTRTVH